MENPAKIVDLKVDTTSKPFEVLGDVVLQQAELGVVVYRFHVSSEDLSEDWKWYLHYRDIDGFGDVVQLGVTVTETEFVLEWAPGPRVAAFPGKLRYQIFAVSEDGAQRWLSAISEGLVMRSLLSDSGLRGEGGNELVMMARLGQSLVYKGSVASMADLPGDPKVGDVYDVRERKGANYVWTGKEWDDMGEEFGIEPISNMDILKIFES